MSRKNTDDRKNNKKESSVVLAIWIIFALILFITFIVNQGKILSNLKQTGFFEKMFGKTPAIIENAKVQQIEKNDVSPVTTTTPNSNAEVNLIPDIGSLISTTTQNKKNQDTSENNDKVEEEALILKDDNETLAFIDSLMGENVTEQEIKQEKAEYLGKTMDIKLYFMCINSDGSVSRKESVRAMPKSTTPLVDALNALIEGPTHDEEKNGCRTLVSDGTRLLGASLKNGIATLNFSEEFEYNQYGIEGIRGQLQQIIYTATAFPTVEKVLFLIEGEKRYYLGSEGVWIGEPLARNSF